MIQNQTARQHANAEYVRQSCIDPTPETCPLSFQKFSTRAAPVSSRRSASSNGEASKNCLAQAESMSNKPAGLHCRTTARKSHSVGREPRTDRAVPQVN